MKDLNLHGRLLRFTIFHYSTLDDLEYSLYYAISNTLLWYSLSLDIYIYANVHYSNYWFRRNAGVFPNGTNLDIIVDDKKSP